MPFDRTALKDQAKRCVAYNSQTFTWGDETFSAVVVPYTDNAAMAGQFVGDNLERVMLRADLTGLSMPANGASFTSDGKHYRVTQTPSVTDGFGLTTLICSVFTVDT